LCQLFLKEVLLKVPCEISHLLSEQVHGAGLTVRVDLAPQRTSEELQVRVKQIEHVQKDA
jgi:hypothetical protein